MKQIPLTKGKFAIVDDEDYEFLSCHKWVFSGKYARRGENGKNIWIHREIIHTPEGMETDHINRNKLDNRKENLRICTRSQNQINSISPRNTSGYKGVSWYGRLKKWRVLISVNGKDVYLGLYDNVIDAAKTYDSAAKTFFGDFAILNFPRPSCD